MDGVHRPVITTCAIISKVKGQGHQAAERRDKKSATSWEWEGLRTSAPCRLWVVRIDLLCFMAGCRIMRLNQAISVLYLSMFYCVVVY